MGRNQSIPELNKVTLAGLRVYPRNPSKLGLAHRRRRGGDGCGCDETTASPALCSPLPSSPIWHLSLAPFHYDSARASNENQTCLPSSILFYPTPARSSRAAKPWRWTFCPAVTPRVPPLPGRDGLRALEILMSLLPCATSMGALTAAWLDRWPCCPSHVPQPCPGTQEDDASQVSPSCVADAGLHAACAIEAATKAPC